LHMAQLMPLPLTVSCFSKIQIGFTFLVPAHPGSPGKGPLNGRLCVCVAVAAASMASTIFLPVCDPLKAWNACKQGLKCQGQGQRHDCQGQGRSFPALRPGQGQGLTSLVVVGGGGM